VLLSSHVLSEVESTCDRVAIGRDGRLARVGGVAELKNIRRHELELTFASAPPLDTFRSLPGLECLDVVSSRACPTRSHAARSSARQP
jgi:ABC-type multidrug transport system ATPase subunit